MAKKCLRKKNGRLSNRGAQKIKSLQKTISELERAIKKRSGKNNLQGACDYNHTSKEELAHLRKRLKEKQKVLSNITQTKKKKG